MLVNGPFIKIGQNLHDPTDMIAARHIANRIGAPFDDARGKDLKTHLIVLYGEPDLRQIAAALGSPGGFASLLHRG